MIQHSAGILAYKYVDGALKVMLAHPGGPFWMKKDKASWSIPKGLLEDGEETKSAAIREFKEETGMDINDLKCIGNVEIIYPGKNKKFVMKTYIANKVNGNPLDLDDNYAYWLPINELTKNEKRFAITHLLDDDLINYFESEKINILFTCDDNHNITNMEIKEA